MKPSGSQVVIICCILVQLVNTRHLNYLLVETHIIARFVLIGLQGLTFLSYPLLGHLADVYLTRYRALKCGLVIIIGSAGYIMVLVFANMIAYGIYKTPIFQDGLVPTVLIPGVTFVIVGVGLFEANALQFGLDQLLEAPTSKMIAFIQWCYWGQSVGELIIFYLSTCPKTVIGIFHTKHEHTLVIVVAAIFILLAVVYAVTLALYCAFRKYFFIQKAGFNNPFKQTYAVLNYSWKHKVPEHRSAFTYWEEDIPRRIDFGKDKYGGPFTNVEVENVKTFLGILPLLLCLFGYQLASDGISAPIQLQRTSCPSLPEMLLFIYNPQHLPALVIVVGIPLYRLLIRKIMPKIETIQMLTKMWVGLYLSLVQVVLYIIVIVNSNDTTHGPHQNHILEPNASSRDTCFNIRTNNLLDSSEDYLVKEPVDNTYLWFIIPQLLNGLSSLLVSLTVFEFICAQAPNFTQGLLIGLWYATFSIRYLVVDVMNFVIVERSSWLIYEGVKGFLILVSLVLFSCVSKCYCYRQRDEIVNVQSIIEDIYDRRIACREEYLARLEENDS